MQKTHFPKLYNGDFVIKTPSIIEKKFKRHAPHSNISLGSKRRDCIDYLIRNQRGDIVIYLACRF